MATQLTHKYIPRVEQTEENIFIEEYYSSTDVKIYIDGIQQTEISYINYSLQEQLKPLYGYASRTFDDIAVGSRIVSGMIKVPIKNPESQSTLEDITNSAITEEDIAVVADYNDQEEEEASAVAWIGNTGGLYNTVTNAVTETVDNILNVSEDLYVAYKTKLLQLGYAVTSATTTAYEIVSALKSFQLSVGIESTGLLTTQTMYAIDEAIDSLLGDDTMTLAANTKIYLGPSDATSYYTIATNQTVSVVETAYEGWSYIITEQGEEGYVTSDSLF